MAQFGSAREWGSRGRRFDSSHSDHFIKKDLIMTHNGRNARKREKALRRKRIVRAITLLFLIVLIYAAFNYRANRTALLTKTDYVHSVHTSLYFFKNTDYIELDDFSKSDLRVKEGRKVNGYNTLTKTKKAVNKAFINQQIKTIDTILKEKDTAHWPTIVAEIRKDASGINKITDSDERKAFLTNTTRYMGMRDADLKKERRILVRLKKTGKRDIILGDLNMLSTGYIYGTVNAMEKVVNENILPYINVDFLNSVAKIDKQSEPALKVVDNDRLFAAFIVDKKETVGGEKQAMALKKKIVGTTDQSKNTTYYNYLVHRVDVLWGYPQLSVVKNGKAYDCYLVDVIADGSKKIPIVLFKDYVSVFASDNILETDIHLQDFPAYEVPQSAVTKQNGETYLTTTTKAYFNQKVKVTVEKVENGNAVLRVSDNPDLSVGTPYRVYP